MKNLSIKFLYALPLLAAAFTSCDDDKVQRIPQVGAFFISATGQDGTEYILQIDDLSSGSMMLSQNVDELESTGYTWIFKDDASYAIGLQYNKGEPGVGLAYGVGADRSVYEIGKFEIKSRYTTYGFCDNYAITAVGGQAIVENGEEREDGVIFNKITLGSSISKKEITMPTRDIAGNGEQATLSGIVDIGNGEFLTGLVLSQPKETTQEGGASSGTVNYPDSVWVAKFDTDFNLKHIYRDNRLSYSSGRMQSQYYSQIGKSDDGTVYVFSGSFDTNTTRNCGAIRIKQGADSFDPSYHFDIEELSGGYRFRKVWHITGNDFLLEFYNDLVPASQGAATRYAVANVHSKTLNWLSGEFPGINDISSTGLPMPYDGKIYLPVKTTGAYPAIYIIDPSGKAARGLEMTGAATIKSVGRLTHY